MFRDDRGESYASKTHGFRFRTVARAVLHTTCKSVFLPPSASPTSAKKSDHNRRRFETSLLPRTPFRRATVSRHARDAAFDKTRARGPAAAAAAVAVAARGHARRLARAQGFCAAGVVLAGVQRARVSRRPPPSLRPRRRSAGRVLPPPPPPVPQIYPCQGISRFVARTLNTR